MERASCISSCVWFCLLLSAVARICRRAIVLRLLITAISAEDMVERCLALPCDRGSRESTEDGEVDAAAVDDAADMSAGVVDVVSVDVGVVIVVIVVVVVVDVAGAVTAVNLGVSVN